MFLFALSPRPNCSSNPFTKGVRKGRVLDEIGSELKEEPNDAGMPDPKYVNEWDRAEIRTL